MKLEIEIQTHVNLLRLNWLLINLMSGIERFDATWPSIRQREKNVLEELAIAAVDQNSWLGSNVEDLFLAGLEGSSESVTADALADLKDLIFWYETEMEIHPLFRCVLFGYYVQLIAPILQTDHEIGVRAAVLTLIKSGYVWARYIKWLPLDNLDINEWMFYFLSVLRDGQLNFLQKIDVGGIGQELTFTEKLLIHIIEQHQGIRTSLTTKKLGKSTATTKRMLNRLIEKRLIERKGAGRAAHYILL